MAGEDDPREELRALLDAITQADARGVPEARLPRGVLLVGPPGGATRRLVEAVATAGGLRFLPVAGGGLGATGPTAGAPRIRATFARARAAAPAVVYIEGAEAIGGADRQGDESYRQLVAELDAFDASRPVLTVAATDRPERLAPPLLRPTRLGWRVRVRSPGP